MKLLSIWNKLIIKLWGLGIGDWGLGPIPNPQSPIPKNKNIKFKCLIYIKNCSSDYFILKNNYFYGG